MQTQKSHGFTIVELLIVIVVIGILAVITVVGYSNVRNRAQQSKIQADLAQLEKSITVARIANASPLFDIVNDGSIDSGCSAKPNGTDLATLAQTDSCWTKYLAALDSISTIGQVNVRNLVDPWGRPYYLNANESENQTTHLCMTDYIAVYPQPFVTGVPSPKTALPLYKASCL